MTQGRDDRIRPFRPGPRNSMGMRPTLIVLALAACNYTPREAEAPATFTAAETTPPRPTDTADPFAAVVWTLNYDLREFDRVWTWLETDVPAGPERDRALAAAGLIARAELDRTDLEAETRAAFHRAVPAFPDDARLPVWRAFIPWLDARDSKDRSGMDASLVELRA